MARGNILLILALFASLSGLSQGLPQLPVDSLTFYYTEGVRLAAEPEKAFEMFEKAITIAPDHAPSLYEAAPLAEREDKALSYALRATEIDPENIWYKERAAHMLAIAGRSDEAIELYRQTTSRGRRFNPDNYRMLALLYAQKGRTDEAMATLASVEVLIGRTPGIIEMKRGILFDAGRMEEAVRQTESYVAATPYDEENRLVLAEMYAMEGRDSLAVATLEDVLAINPDNAEAKRLLAPVAPTEQDPESLLAGGDIDGALAVLKRRTEQKAALDDYTLLIDIEAYLARADSVEMYSRRAIEEYPREVRFYLFKSMAEQLLSRLDDARQTLSDALKVARTDSLRSEIWGGMGNLLHEEGNDKKAFYAFRKALRYNPDNALVLNNYAYFLATGETPTAPTAKELDRALEMSTRVVELEPGNATYLDTLAWILFLKGDYAEARKIMSQALPLDRSNSPELLLHYGDILWALGEEFMATVYWKRARDAGYDPAVEIEERLSRIK